MIQTTWQIGRIFNFKDVVEWYILYSIQNGICTFIPEKTVKLIRGKNPKVLTDGKYKERIKQIPEAELEQLINTNQIICHPVRCYSILQGTTIQIGLKR